MQLVSSYPFSYIYNCVQKSGTYSTAPGVQALGQGSSPTSEDQTSQLAREHKVKRPMRQQPHCLVWGMST